MGSNWTEADLAAHQMRMAKLRVAAAPATPLVPVRFNKSPTDAGCDPAGGEAGEKLSPQSSKPTVASKPKRARTEEALQKQVATFLDVALPPDYRWFHTPNERGTRAGWEQGKFASMGVKPGVFDITILTPRCTFIGIELKSATGSLSKHQRGWRDWCRSIGAPWFLCRSLDDVIEALGSLQIRLLARAS